MDEDSDLANLIYSGLLRYNGSGILIPDLAESYTVSDDGLHYTVKLRSDIRWHDGVAVTADDVIFTIATAQNSDYKSPQRINWQGVAVGKTDDRTVVFSLKNRYAQFTSNLTLGILPKHVWQNITPANFALVDFNLKPIGSGPYRFSKMQRDALGTIRSLELSAFDKSLPHRPYIDTIDFIFYDSEQSLIAGYNSGEIEGLSSVSPLKVGSLRLPGQITVHELMIPRYFAVFFNQNKSQPLSDKNVRVALELATDKNAIIYSALDDHGAVADSPLLPGIINIPANKVSYPFDIAKAGKQLDDGGWTMTDGETVRSKLFRAKTKSEKDQQIPLTLEITTSSLPEIVAVAQAIKAQWEPLGVQISIRTLSVSEVQQAIKDRNYEALLFGQVLGLDPDPFSFWDSSQKTDPGRNLALYDNSTADKLLKDARQTMDATARNAKYAQLQDIILTDAPAVFLYSPNYLYVQPARIKNNTAKIVTIPSERFDTVSEWHINTARSFEKK